MINAYWEPLTFQLPTTDGLVWRIWVNTERPFPENICAWEEAALVAEPKVQVAARSIVILVS